MQEVTLPNGQIIYVPDGVTSQEGVLMHVKRTDPALYRELLSPTGAMVGRERAVPGAMARLGRGARDVGMGTLQLVGALSPEEQAAESTLIRDYEAAVGPGTDWWRMGGQIGAGSPLMAVPAGGGLLARGALGSLAGGVGGATLYADEPGERLANVALGTTGGALGGLAAPWVTGALGTVASAAGRGAQAVGQGARSLWARLNPQIKTRVTLELGEALQRAGQGPAPAPAPLMRSMQEEAARAMRETGDFDADAIVRRARAQQHGFTGPSAPIRHQLTQDPMAYGEAMTTAQTEAGRPIQARLAAQQERSRQLLGEQAEAYGVGAGPYETGAAVRDVTAQRAADWQKAVGELYDLAEESVGPDTPMPLDALEAAWERVRPDFEDVIPSPVQTRISQILDPEGPRPSSVEEIAALDKMINRRIGTAEKPAQREAMRELKTGVEGVLDDFAESGAGGDEFTAAYRAAKAEAAERFGAIQPSKRIRIVRDLMDDKIPPEKFVERRIIGGSVDDITTLRDFLATTEGGATPGAAEAWRRVQRATMDFIYDRTVPREGGNVSPAAYRRALNRIGDDKLRAIFGPERAGILRSIERTFDDLFTEPRPTGITSAGRSGTAQSLRRMLDLTMRWVAPEPAMQAAGALGQAGAARAQAEAVSELMSQSAQPSLGPNPAAPIVSGLDALGRALVRPTRQVGTYAAPGLLTPPILDRFGAQ